MIDIRSLLLAATCGLAASTQGLAQTCEERLTALDASADRRFGSSVAIEGTRLVVGSEGHAGWPIAGSAYVLERVGASWVEDAQLVPAGGGAADLFGAAVELAGDIAFIGAPGTGDTGSGPGSVHVFERRGGAWSEVQVLAGSDVLPEEGFGRALAVEDGRLLVGAPRHDSPFFHEGAVYVFEHGPGGWVEVQKLTPGDPVTGKQFGISIDVAGTSAMIGSLPSPSLPGGAYIFERGPGGWVETEKLLGSTSNTGDGFGYAVAFDGSRALVGADQLNGHFIDEGAVFAFELGPGGWSETQIIRADSNEIELFGVSIAMDGDLAAVGSLFRDSSGRNTGAVILLRRGTAGWERTGELFDPLGEADDRFGQVLGIEGSRVVVGAPRAGPSSAGIAFSYDIDACLFGTKYCGPAVPSHIGVPGELAALAHADGGAYTLTLSATRLPNFQFGYFLASRTQGLHFPPASHGFVCLGGDIGRFVAGIGNTDTHGSLSLVVDTSAIPVNPPAAILPGETWNFQCWYRSGVHNNFTDAVSILFP